jgi:Rrf2 family protein
LFNWDLVLTKYELKFSTRTRYGIRSMIEIGMDTSGKGVFQKQIAEKQEISVKYLDHIIHALKTSGLISNVKGRKSGYVLTRPPDEITMLDIHNSFESGICVIDCLSPNITCDRNERCAARGFWGHVNNKIINYFKSVTLQDMIDEQSCLDDAVNL